MRFSYRLSGYSIGRVEGEGVLTSLGPRFMALMADRKDSDKAARLQVQVLLVLRIISDVLYSF